ncbi:hypothetical protein C8R42DRAFT_641093 [Lentinula raphanica]|nr:hypothetical protein C8R42DRAFT_641093 [Lentinula raphanica]
MLSLSRSADGYKMSSFNLRLVQYLHWFMVIGLGTDCHILYTPYESSAGLEIMNENEYRYSLWGRRYERQKVFAIVLTSPSGNDYLHSEDTRQVGGSCSGWSTHKASCGSQRVGVQRRRSGSEYQIREHCSRNAVGDRKKVKEVQLGRTAVNGEQRLASDIALGDVA